MSTSFHNDLPPAPAPRRLRWTSFPIITPCSTCGGQTREQVPGVVELCDCRLPDWTPQPPAPVAAPVRPVEPEPGSVAESLANERVLEAWRLRKRGLDPERGVA